MPSLRDRAKGKASELKLNELERWRTRTREGARKLEIIEGHRHQLKLELES